MQLQKNQDGSPAVDFVKLAQASEGLSGAEICLICREAGLMALTEDSNIEKASLDELFVKQTHLE
jgi:ATP-dependent 26S proteasome regulatory subunit